MSEQVMGGSSFEELVDDGVFEFVGLDNDQPTFRLVPEIAKEKAPDLYFQQDNEMWEALFRAVDNGCIVLSYTISETGELETHIDFTDECDADFMSEFIFEDDDN